MSVRFAPSPTGAFHAGNFRTAWISHELARALGVPWVVRFEDIDLPRVVPGALEHQQKELKLLGLIADRTLLQTRAFERHWLAFERARVEKRVYPCFCSRADVQRALEASASAPHAAVPVYGGRCRDLGDARPQAASSRLPTIAWRFRGPDAGGALDFIVARSSPDLQAGSPAKMSFIPAYNWACAIDDYDGDFDLLVRAWDLESSLAPQRLVQSMLRGWGEPGRIPAIFHASLVTDDAGHRLEKRTRGVTLAELLEKMPLGSLLEKFRASFKVEKREIVPGLAWGEARRTLTLGELFSGGR